MNGDKEMFGFERLQEALAQCGNLSAASIRDRLLQVLKDHTGSAEQHDDVTVVVVRVL
jgi:serine phosphatase RsbU (regulator of sigma subunit)